MKHNAYQCLSIIHETLYAQSAIITQDAHTFSCFPIDTMAQALGLLLISIPVTEIHQHKHSPYPVLCENMDGHFCVGVRNTTRIKHSWYCVPTQGACIEGYGALLMWLCRFFKKESLCIGVTGILSVVIFALVLWLSMGVFTTGGMSSYDLPPLMGLCLLALFSAMMMGLSDFFGRAAKIRALLLLMPRVWMRILHVPLSLSRQWVPGQIVQQWLAYHHAVSVLVSSTVSCILDGCAVIALLFGMFYCAPMITMAFVVMMFSVAACRCHGWCARVLPEYAAREEQSSFAVFLTEILLQMEKIRSSFSEPRVYQRWLQSTLTSVHQRARVLSWDARDARWVSIATTGVWLLTAAFVYWQGSGAHALVWMIFIVCAGQFAFFFEKVMMSVRAMIQHTPRLQTFGACISGFVAEEQCVNTAAILTGKVVLKDVCVKHPTLDRWIVDHVSLQIEPGECVAIVGPSGAGKSSLLRVLLGLIDTHSGQVWFETTGLSTTASPADRRAQCGAVLQGSTLLPGTLFSNIAMQSDLSTSRAWELLQAVGMADDVRRMPMQLLTRVSDSPGDSFSGGQRQKIVIARALARSPRILLFDEATSALDNHSQAVINATLAKLSITRIVVAHRHSTIVNADKMYVMQAGRIVDTSVAANRHCAFSAHC